MPILRMNSLFHYYFHSIVYYFGINFFYFLLYIAIYKRYKMLNLCSDSLELSKNSYQRSYRIRYSLKYRKRSTESNCRIVLVYYVYYWGSIRRDLFKNENRTLHYLFEKVSFYSKILIFYFYLN